MRKYLMAVVQMDTRENKEKNLRDACGFIDEAAARGAKFVSFPEVFNVIDTGQESPEAIPEGRTISLMAEKAREHGLWIHCGSIAESNPDGDRYFNTTALLNPKGELVAKYRKLHTYDVTLPDGTIADESARVKPGQDMVVVNTEMGVLGLSICYDIRFCEMYRWMALHGAQIFFTGASFRMPTGKDHWEVLQRARAIENGCYVAAAAQIGKKKGTTDTFGSSMIVDPWGTVIARARETAGIAVGEIDLDYLDKVRAMMPSLKNRRGDVYDTISL